MSTYSYGYMKMRSPRSSAQRNRNGAATQVIVMPCCGTSRTLHDDIGPGVVVRVCGKCGVRWLVSYLGDGKFRFASARRQA